MVFIAPVALALLSLGFAGGQSLTVYHKVVLSAHTVTDLVSRTHLRDTIPTRPARSCWPKALSTPTSCCRR